MNQIAIIGAGGYAREITATLRSIKNPDCTIEYFAETTHMNATTSAYPALPLKNLGESKDIYVAIGDGILRQRLLSLVSSKNNFPVLIHPQTVIGPDCSLKEGVQIQQFSTITANVSIGKFTQINVQVGIGHDSQLGEYVTLSPRVSLSGGVKVGDFVSIGTGAIVLPKVSICDNAVIGAGAVVTKDITEPGTYVGVPAKRRV